MAKQKKPARKGGAKKIAPKKVAKKVPAKRKPIPQQVVERTVALRTKLDPAKPIDDGAERAVPIHDHSMDAQQRQLRGAPQPPTQRSKFWRQYQDTTTGAFIGWARARLLAAGQVVSRLRLRKTKGS